MGEKLGPWLALSLSLHGVPWLFARFPSPLPQPPPTFVQLLPSPEKPPVPSTRKGKGKRGHAPQKTAVPRLSDLGIGWSEKGIPSASYAEGSRAGRGFGADGGSAVLETLKRTVPLESIRAQVDSALDYPAAFRERNVAGTVTAEVRFGENGKLEKRSARSESRYLRVHILRVLRQSLSEGLPSTYTQGEPLTVRFRFDFLLSDRAQAGNSLLPTKKDGFHFQRVGRGFGQWKAGPLGGYWFFPAVSIDPNWFIENAQKAFTKKAEIDPMELYRNDPEF